MSRPPDAITKRKRVETENETKRILLALEEHLNRSTEEEFLHYINGIQPPVGPERLRLALQIFRAASRP
jgi:hypothetical protein